MITSTKELQYSRRQSDKLSDNLLIQKNNSTKKKQTPKNTKYFSRNRKQMIFQSHDQLHKAPRKSQRLSNLAQLNSFSQVVKAFPLTQSNLTPCSNQNLKQSSFLLSGGKIGGLKKPFQYMTLKMKKRKDTAFRNFFSNMIKQDSSLKKKMTKSTSKKRASLRKSRSKKKKKAGFASGIKGFDKDRSLSISGSSYNNFVKIRDKMNNFDTPQGSMNSKKLKKRWDFKVLKKSSESLKPDKIKSKINAMNLSENLKSSSVLSLKAKLKLKDSRKLILTHNAVQTENLKLKGLLAKMIILLSKSDRKNELQNLLKQFPTDDDFTLQLEDLIENDDLFLQGLKNKKSVGKDRKTISTQTDFKQEKEDSEVILDDKPMKTRPENDSKKKKKKNKRNSLMAQSTEIAKSEVEFKKKKKKLRKTNSNFPNNSTPNIDNYASNHEGNVIKNISANQFSNTVGDLKGGSASEENDLNFEGIGNNFEEIEKFKRLDINDVDPNMLEFLMEGIELDESIEKLEGCIQGKNYLDERRRSSSCSSYGYIPIKNFKRFKN